MSRKRKMRSLFLSLTSSRSRSQWVAAVASASIAVAVLFSVAVARRRSLSSRNRLSKKAQRKAKWAEEKKRRKERGYIATEPRVRKGPPKRELWTVAEEGSSEAMALARLPERSRVPPAPGAFLQGTFTGPPLSRDLSRSFIYVSGGRLRGKTLTQVERLCLLISFEECAII